MKRVPDETKENRPDPDPFRFQGLFDIGTGGLATRTFRLCVVIFFALLRLPFVLLAIVWVAVVSYLVVIPQLKPVMSFVLGCTARLVGFVLGILHIEVVNKASTPNVAPIMVSNHVSYLDILIIMSLFGTEYSFVAQSRLKEAPWLRRICDSFGIVWVDQTKSDGTTKRMLQALRSGRKLVMFPEGLMTNGESMLKFRRGAFVLEQSVRPIAIQWGNIKQDDKNGRVHFSPASRPHIMSTPQKVWHIIRMMGEPWTPVKVTFLDDYNPTTEESENPSLYALNVRNVIAQEVGCLLSEKTFLDWEEFQTKSTKA